MPDLARLILHLRPTHQDTIPSWTGRAAHAWFLNEVRRVNPALSAQAHDGPGLKPLTVSGLTPAPETELQTIHPIQTLQLHITTLTPALSHLALQNLVPAWPGQIATLHDQPLLISSVEVLTADFAAMLAARTSEPLQDQLSLTFHSPTMFKRTGGHQIAQPLPEYVFGSLLDRWQAFSPVALPGEDLRTAFTHMLKLTAQRTRTRQMRLAQGKRGTMNGFVGEASFQLQGASHAQLIAWHTLADFALFSGAGAKTTIGLGWVSR